MDKQTFYFELTERLTKLGVSRHYIERHMKQFDSFFEGKSEEQISCEIDRLGDLDRVAARIKRMTDKIVEQEQSVSVKEASESISETPTTVTEKEPVAETEIIPEQNETVASVGEDPENTPAGDEETPMFDNEDIISFTPICKDDEGDAEPDSMITESEVEIHEEKPHYHGRMRGELSVSDPGRIVKSTLDEETVRKNTIKFWLLFVATTPITLAILAVTVAVFALIFFMIAVLIIAFVATLVAVTAVGTLVSVFGLIFGVALMMSNLPVGLYECGLSIIVGASAMFVGILLYNVAVRLLPFLAKWLTVLFKFIFRKYKELFVYLKKECIGL